MTVNRATYAILAHHWHPRILIRRIRAARHPLRPLPSALRSEHLQLFHCLSFIIVLLYRFFLNFERGGFTVRFSFNSTYVYHRNLSKFNVYFLILRAKVSSGERFLDVSQGLESPLFPPRSSLFPDSWLSVINGSRELGSLRSSRNSAARRIHEPGGTLCTVSETVVLARN